MSRPNRAVVSFLVGVVIVAFALVALGRLAKDESSNDESSNDSLSSCLIETPQATIVDSAQEGCVAVIARACEQANTALERWSAQALKEVASPSVDATVAFDLYPGLRDKRTNRDVDCSVRSDPSVSESNEHE